MKQFLDLLGKKVKDRISGVQGIVTSVGFDLYGCVQCIVDHTKDGDERKAAWFDHKRLEVMDETPVMAQPVWPDEPGIERGGFDKPLMGDGA